MSLLCREAIKDFWTYFIFSLVVLAFILLMDRLFLLADLLVRKGISIIAVTEIALFSMPFVISISAPLGGLIGGVITFGRMAQDNEILAVRAAGIPAVRISLPVMACGLLLVPLMITFNGYVVPEAQHRVRNLLTDIARKKPALRIQERVFIDDFPGYIVYIGSIDERLSTISNAVIFERGLGRRFQRFITAPRGSVRYTPDNCYLVLTLYDGEIHELLNNNNYRLLAFKEQIINIPSDGGLVRQGRDYRTDDEMRFSHLWQKLYEGEKDVAELSSQLLELSQQASDKEILSFRLEELNTRIRYRRMEMVRSIIELHKRFSLAFSCFLFLFFGVPLGLLLRRGGIGTGFIVGLIFFAIYYIMLLAGENLAENLKLTPFLGMWLPNLMLVFPVVELSIRAFYDFSLVRFLGKRYL